MKDLVRDGYIDQSVSLQVLRDKKKISLLQTIANTKEVIVTEILFLLKMEPLK